MALSRVSTTTGLFLSGGANRGHVLRRRRPLLEESQRWPAFDGAGNARTSRDKEHVERRAVIEAVIGREGKTTIAHNRFQRVRNQMHPRVRHAREDFVRPGQIKLREPGEEKHSDVSRQGSPWSCNVSTKPFGEANRLASERSRDHRERSFR